MGLAGLGDLVLTCTDDQSRNRRFGLALAAGKSTAEAQREIGQVVEGVLAARAVRDVAGSHQRRDADRGADLPRDLRRTARRAKPSRRSWAARSSPRTQ